MSARSGWASFSVSSALALVLLVLLPQSAAGGNNRGNCTPPWVSSGIGGGCVIPVTTIIGDLDSNGLSVDLTSDGQGAYVNGAAGVTTWVSPDWQVITLNSTTRTVGLGFQQSDAIVPGDPHYQAPANPPYWGMQWFPSKIEVKCMNFNNNMLTMTAGTQFTCPLVDKFIYSSTIEYGLQPGLSFTGFPETTDVQVRCNTVDSFGCNDWFIDPIGLGEAVGRLMQTVTVKNQQQKTDEGDFYMRFHIHITRP